MVIIGTRFQIMQRLDTNQNTILLIGKERIILALDWGLPHLSIISVFRMSIILRNISKDIFKRMRRIVII